MAKRQTLEQIDASIKRTTSKLKRWSNKLVKLQAQRKRAIERLTAEVKAKAQQASVVKKLFKETAANE